MQSAIAHLELLGKIPIEFRSALARQGRRRLFRTGSYLLQQGEHNECAYVIVRGSVRVERTHPDLIEPVGLAELGPGAVIGQLGLLDGWASLVTATATEDTEALELGASALARVALHAPSNAGVLLQLLSLRLLSAAELEQLSRAEAGAAPANDGPAPWATVGTDGIG